MSAIRRLAIVNRGEPAVRALNAIADVNHGAGEHRLTSIVLYTEPDAQSVFVRRADEAISLGPATFVDPEDGARKATYLDEARVVDALVAARADAVWVGWGFEAEHAALAELCEKAGIVFVGPSSATIRLFNDKVAAKLLAEQADVPVLPWSGGPVETVEAAARHAEQLGYPVILKAAAGYGSRGTRVVRRVEELPGGFRSARDEAELAYGDPAVFVEKYLSRARELEVQIIADGAGGTLAVGLLDGSVQRRHEKVLEECACPVVDAAVERSIRDAAVHLMNVANYRSAGTVAFLIDPDTMDYRFLGVSPYLRADHPVTEETAGVDLVRLQLHVAGGGRLNGALPPVTGHAVEARLSAEDPADNFAPAPGRLSLWRPPSGPGIRVETGVTAGDDVAPEFDPLIAKIVAWGPDRPAALARLTRALEDTAVVVDGGTTNRSFLLHLLRHPDVRSGHVDNAWLDRVVGASGYRPPADPVAVLISAVEAYEAEEVAARQAFHASARRGRPEVPDTVGQEVRLGYRGVRYAFTVYRTGPETYTVATGSVAVPLRVQRTGDYERRVVVAGRSHRVLISTQGSSFLAEVDGTTHRVQLDEGGVVRALGPAFVIDVLVSAGDEVQAGDALVIVETMKMETAITAPFAGTVAEVLVGAKVQVEHSAPLLRLQETTLRDSGAGEPVEFPGIPATDPARRVATPPAQLRRYLLGFDLDPETLARAREKVAAPDGDGDVPGEVELVRLFADICTLQRPEGQGGSDTSPLEHVRHYLQWLDADRAGLPERVRADLLTMLARYGITSLDDSPELEAAAVWMWRAFLRADELAPTVTIVLQRRLRERVEVPVDAGPEVRAMLARLAAAAQARFPVIADLARDLLFRYFDEPLIERVVAEVFAEMEGHFDALRADPDGADREERIARLVWAPQPMRSMLLRRWREASPAFRHVLLEVHLRRYYRTRALHDLRFEERDGLTLGSADYEHDGKRVHLVAFYAAEDELVAAARSVAAHLADVDPERLVVADVMSWRSGERTDEVGPELEELLTHVDFGRPLHRFDISVTSAGTGLEHTRTARFTYRQTDDGFVEEELYRNLHPMIAKRMDLWRLSNFQLTRLRSVEDVYLFRGVARDNPSDVRLFALAEVRDLTPVRDASGRIVSLPLLERMGLQSLAAMHEAMAGIPVKKRPKGNRVVLYVRPPFDIPAEGWRDLALPFQPLAANAGLHKIVLRVQIPEGGRLSDSILEFTGTDEPEPRLRVRTPHDQPIRPLTKYHQKVLRAEAMGAPYPYELARMLSPDEADASDFPKGRFVEYDLDEENNLVPVDRPYGGNSANLVVGLLTSYPDGIPEGMTRVALFGDPTRRLGALAEPECRRVNAALDLAERLHVPLEWYALSSGARIAMDSGTENMDWIGAVLRRIIEFTQAGGEINVVVTGINVGAQPYWNAEATMLMHTRGILVMTPESAMVLTGKTSLDYSGGVSAEDNFGIGGFERVMGPNGQGQYWAPTLQDACQLLMRHYEHTYVVPGERYPRRRPTTDPRTRDVRTAPHERLSGSDFTTVGDIFSAEHNPERKKPFRIRAIMRAVSDAESEPLERWARWRGGETSVVWDTHVGGIPVCMLGLESRTLARRGFLPADGPAEWTSGTLFPQSSRKVARALNAASGNRPVVVLANLSGFDGSPESMRRWQLEYGAEIGRAVTNFVGPIVFVVVSRYHGGAFVVFSKTLNKNLEIAAVEGSYASVIGGAPAAGVVLVREVDARTDADERIVRLREQLAEHDSPALRAELHDVRRVVRAEKLGEVADEFDGVHSIQRALAVGSVDHIIPGAELRPYVIDAVERGMARGD